ncbi:MAG: hypothetical protein JW891_16805 [Candidatus Lokiarchaeota archaeon]|nr:hypothetical protein [Candidatus Lokiarchaeota archaeon]
MFAIFLYKKSSNSGSKWFHTTFSSKLQGSRTQIPPKKTLTPKASVKSPEKLASAKIARIEDKKESNETEIAVIKAQYTCPVHKGLIEVGELYLCRNCQTYYCMKCVDILKKKGESCWSCNKPFE